MALTVTQTRIPEVLLIRPDIFGDARGHFFESFNQAAFAKATGIQHQFVQDNQSRSVRSVLRGLHYQLHQPQAKLVRVLSGSIYDVAVDLRQSSKTFGHWVGFELSAENCEQAFIPAGFAHGFLVLSETADVFYKTSDYWDPTSERALKWDDPTVGITWPSTESPILAAKDAAGSNWDDSTFFV
jgi:dTDP-4-dehydrorhamnose 3,5-epimerase